jgi:hypothetical protein
VRRDILQALLRVLAMAEQAKATGCSQAHIQLIGFPRINNTLLAGSPFVGKLEVMLLLAGLPYNGFTGSPVDKKVAPRGKVCVAASTVLNGSVSAPLCVLQFQDSPNSKQAYCICWCAGTESVVFNSCIAYCFEAGALLPSYPTSTLLVIQ